MQSASPSWYTECSVIVNPLPMCILIFQRLQQDLSILFPPDILIYPLAAFFLVLSWSVGIQRIEMVS